MRLSSRHEDGFSMIEIAVAIVVLGVVLAGFLPFVVSSLQLAVQNSEIAQANQHVATRLETLRSVSPCPDGTVSETVGAFTVTTVSTGCTSALATVVVSAAKGSDMLAEATTKYATGVNP